MARAADITGLFRICVEPDAVFVLAGAGGVERPVRAATSDIDFVPGIGARLYFHGAGAELALVVRGAD